MHGNTKLKLSSGVSLQFSPHCNVLYICTSDLQLFLIFSTLHCVVHRNFFLPVVTVLRSTLHYVHKHLIWDVTSYNMVMLLPMFFEETFCLHLQGRRQHVHLKMSVPHYQTTWCYSPEGCDPNICCC